MGQLKIAADCYAIGAPGAAPVCAFDRKRRDIGISIDQTAPARGQFREDPMRSRCVFARENGRSARIRTEPLATAMPERVPRRSVPIHAPNGPFQFGPSHLVFHVDLRHVQRRNGRYVLRDAPEFHGDRHLRIFEAKNEVLRKAFSGHGAVEDRVPESGRRSPPNQGVGAK